MLASIFIIGFYFLWDFICSNEENYSVPMCMVNETEVYTTRKYKIQKKQKHLKKVRFRNRMIYMLNLRCSWMQKAEEYCLKKMEDKNVRWQAQQRL